MSIVSTIMLTLIACDFRRRAGHDNYPDHGLARLLKMKAVAGLL